MNWPRFLTFVRNTWGNKASKITPDDVKRVREETIGRSTFWTPDELLAEHPLEVEFATSVRETDEFSNEALEKELLALPSTELAEVAIVEGDAERGKILFYQSAAACFACHDPGPGAPRLGPDLKTITTELKLDELVDAILRPSKRIDKEFAQVNVATVDGNVLTGIRVSETENEIVLRNLAQPKPIVIQKEDVDQVMDSSKSLMPEKLARQLKNRGEFNDLLKYVIEIRKR